MNPSTSQTGTDFSYVSTTDPDEKLILCVNPDTKELMKCNKLKLERVADIGALKLRELVTQPCFQDNSLIFEKLLWDENFVMCVYPPGSGKTTIAKLFEFYLSRNDIPEEVRNWLNTCEFKKTEDIRAQEDATYQKFRSSSPFVLYLDFSKIKGEMLESLEDAYGKCLLECCKNAGLPYNMRSKEEELIDKDPNNVWTSLSRLRSGICGHFSGNLYIILDSLDNMYNLIANLPISSSKQLYSKFTKDIQGLIDKDDPRMKVFCFGVSPYLITEFQTKMVHSIIDKENVVSKYFSFSDESIRKAIQAWQLVDVSVDQVKAVAQFQYHQNIFINPYLCISYLKSLKDKKPFAVNVSPRSLWMSCIFDENDLNVLSSLLSGELNCKFDMCVTMRSMCTIPESLKSRELYYPLFVFGGFFSCREENDESFTLFISNDTTRILIHYHLDVLFLNKFKLPVLQSKEILDVFLAKNFSSFCVILSNAMSNRSSLMSANEMTYHNYIAGIFYHLEKKGYQMKNDKDIASVRPGAVYINDEGAILMEYKTIKLDKKEKRKIRESVRSKVVTKCKTTVREACHVQIQEYTPAVSTKYRKNV